MLCSGTILPDTNLAVEEYLQQHHQLPFVCSINKLLSLHEFFGVLCAPIFGTYGSIPLASAALRAGFAFPSAGWLQSIQASARAAI